MIHERQLMALRMQPDESVAQYLGSGQNDLKQKLEACGEASVMAAG